MLYLLSQVTMCLILIYTCKHCNDLCQGGFMVALFGQAHGKMDTLPSKRSIACRWCGEAKIYKQA